MVADALSRPPRALSVPGSTTVAGVKVPSGSLATPKGSDGTAGASPQLPPLHNPQAVLDTAGPPPAPTPLSSVVDLAAIAAAQPGCTETVALVGYPSLRISTCVVGGISLL